MNVTFTKKPEEIVCRRYSECTLKACGPSHLLWGMARVCDWFMSYDSCQQIEDGCIIVAHGWLDEEYMKKYKYAGLTVRVE